MANQETIYIDPLSTTSLLLEIIVNNNCISKATGFVINRGGTDFLITNWHVVSGKNSDNGQLLSDTGAIPDSLAIIHHARARLGSWYRAIEPLYDEEGNPRWHEHPDGSRIDVVALPLQNTPPELVTYPFDLNLADVDLVPQPAMPISIIGYPFGLSTAGAWPIWKTGHIASDPDLDYDGRPAFLIDATTRGGMSGSPVIVRMTGGYKDKKGTYIISSGITTKFLGVYSGRIHGQAEIGRVWRPRVLNEILQQIGR